MFHQDILMYTKEEREEEWNNVLYVQNNDVVLRDRLMTDAALGGPRPIKSEHSYSLRLSSPPPSPAMPGGDPHTPNSSSSSGTVDPTTASTAASIDFVHLDHKSHELLRGRIDEMEDYFPTISMSTASGRGEASSSLTSSSTSTVILKRNGLVPEDNEVCSEIKDEPISEPPSPCAPCQSSCDMVDDKSTITMVPPQSLHYANTRLPRHSSDSEEEDEDMAVEIEDSNLIDEAKQTILRTSRQGLPPTPPSSASSDSEGTASASCSPERRDSQTHVQNLKGLLAPSRLYVTTSSSHTTRQPIHTPLISCQPKGSTGLLVLTDEEKRTLLAEGYPVPTKLPLSKQEEKSLKKIRRKIKNKISAQESRRKKKEYVDSLERRVDILMAENTSYKDKLNALEDTNRELLKEMQRLQGMLRLQRS
ncbi:PREDICTED: cyclic AMP response element-binding protein A isoform X2 [Dinoponera quadriceps]|nr:PREDICTED: cyclic AMP response element-binding protein A isoform X2 [Dinoponera quadriceps]